MSQTNLLFSPVSSNRKAAVTSNGRVSRPKTAKSAKQAYYDLGKNDPDRRASQVTVSKKLIDPKLTQKKQMDFSSR